MSYIMFRIESNHSMEEYELRDWLAELHSSSSAWATHCCGDRELADEVLQCVYLKVLAAKPSYRGHAAFRTWLFAAIRNMSIDHRRKRWWSRVVRLDLELIYELIDPCSDPKPKDVEDEELTMIRTALDRLPERQREVAHLVFYQDLTLAESAEVMGVRIGTARQHYARAKESLRLYLSSQWKRSDESVV